MDFTVIQDALVAGSIGLLAGIGGGYLFCWSHHLFNKELHK